MCTQILYFGIHFPNLSTVTKLLYKLLRSTTAGTCGPATPVLKFYDVALPTVVAADKSSYGLGGVLLQLPNGDWKPVVYYSLIYHIDKICSDLEKNIWQVFGCIKSPWSALKTLNE